MYSRNRGDENTELEALFRAYRDACQAPEPSANFMPEIWQRIEERQRSVFFLGRWARALATAAAVLSLAMAAYLYTPHAQKSIFYVESYVEALSAGHALDSPEFTDTSLDEL
jgi:hypothetical protein